MAARSVSNNRSIINRPSIASSQETCSITCHRLHATMGGAVSELQAAEAMELAEISQFTPTEVKKLYKRFRKLDKKKTGTISHDDFLTVPELAMNPLVERIIDVFITDSDHESNINFRDFIVALSVFSTKSAHEPRLRFAFRIYDINNDGFITEDDLYKVLKMMVGDNISDTALQDIVSNTIKVADVDGDGKLSFPEFANALQSGSGGAFALSNMSVEVNKF